MSSFIPPATVQHGKELQNSSMLTHNTERVENRGRSEELQPLLTEKEAAMQMRISVAALRKWRQQGRPPTYIRVGARVRYRPEDLDAWLKAQAVNPVSQSPSKMGADLVRGHRD